MDRNIRDELIAEVDRRVVKDRAARVARDRRRIREQLDDLRDDGLRLAQILRQSKQISSKSLCRSGIWVFHG